MMLPLWLEAKINLQNQQVSNVHTMEGTQKASFGFKTQKKQRTYL